MRSRVRVEDAQIVVPLDGLSFWPLRTVIPAVDPAIAIIVVVVVVVINGRHELGMFRGLMPLLPPIHLAQLLARFMRPSFSSHLLNTFIVTSSC